MKKVFFIKEEKEINEIIENLKIPKTGIILLNGDLGVGKTTITKKIAQKIGILDDINSPTFSLYKLYESGEIKLCHVDAYRIEDPYEDIGLAEYIDEYLIIIEWGEKIKPFLEKLKFIEINIFYDEKGRKIEIL